MMSKSSEKKKNYRHAQNLYSTRRGSLKPDIQKKTGSNGKGPS